MQIAPIQSGSNRDASQETIIKSQLNRHELKTVTFLEMCCFANAAMAPLLQRWPHKPQTIKTSRIRKKEGNKPLTLTIF